MKHAVLRGTP